MTALKPGLCAIVLTAMLSLPCAASAETLKVLTAGAFKNVLIAMLPQFQAGGHEVIWETDTVGNLARRVEAGEMFDVLFASPAAMDQLHKSGKVGSSVDLARVGVGVAYREGAPKPAIGTVEDFKQTLLSAKGVAYIDPASGGTSGIYVDRLIDKLGIGTQVRAKSFLTQGGYSADRVVSGEADVAIQQISELLPVKGVVLAGPLPAEIQSYTIYSGVIATGTAKAATAQALIALIESSAGDSVITAKGMEPIVRPAPPK